MNETWKAISDYEGYYEVSNLGQIRSVNRVVITRNNKKYHYKSKLLKQQPHNSKYLKVELVKESKQKTYLVHRLVANTFIPNPQSKPQVNHKDGNKQNNIHTNLEWSTSKENNKHAWETGLTTPSKPMKGVFGYDNPTSRPVLQFKLNGEFITEYGGLSEAERKTGIKHQHIYRVCRNKRKQTGGFIWKYKD